MFNKHFACLGHGEMELYSNDSGLQQGEQNIWKKIPQERPLQSMWFKYESDLFKMSSVQSDCLKLWISR